MDLFTRVAPIVLAIALGSGLAAGGGAQAAPGDLAGISAAVRGDVQLTSVVSREVRAVAGGEDVLFGDAVETADSSGMQLLLLDESVFTIGANAQLVIDSFVFDPSTGEGRLAADLVKGAFRFVSGGLSAQDPEQVDLRLPEGTIGVRGTIVSALVTPTGSFVMLDGPGRGNDAFERRGLVTVSAQGSSVELERPGFATFVPLGGAPQAPFLATPELRQRFAQALSARPAGTGQQDAGGGSGGPVDPVGESGVTTTAAFGSLSVEQQVEGVSTVAFSSEPDDPDGRGARSGTSIESEFSIDTSETEAELQLATEVTEMADEVFEPMDPETIARIDSLNSTAVDHFRGEGSFSLTVDDPDDGPTTSRGTSLLSLTIDFGNRMLGDAQSGLRLRADDFDRTVVIDNIRFDEGVDGFARFEQFNPDETDEIRDGSYMVISGREFVASELSGDFRLVFDTETTGRAIIVDAARQDGRSPGLQ